MANSKPESSKRSAIVGGGGAGGGRKGKSGGSENKRNKSKSDDPSEEKSAPEKEPEHREKWKKGKKNLKEIVNANKSTGGGSSRKKSAEKNPTEVESKEKEAEKLKLAEVIQQSITQLKVMAVEEMIENSIIKGSKKRLRDALREKSRPVSSNIVFKDTHEQLEKRELDQKDLDLIERAKTCFDEANNIWNMAWKIICERFYVINGAKIVVHELRDSWRRLIQQQWMDEDFAHGSYLPDQVRLKTDSPPLPLHLDSWARGAIEVLPDERRESVMDPFIRDYNNFLPLFSAESERRKTKSKINYTFHTVHTVPTSKRQKSVMEAHTRRKSLFQTSHTSLNILENVERDAEYARRLPDQSSKTSSTAEGTETSQEEKMTPTEKHEKGIFGDYDMNILDSQSDEEEEPSKLNLELENGNINLPKVRGIFEETENYPQGQETSQFSDSSSSATPIPKSTAVSQNLSLAPKEAIVFEIETTEDEKESIKSETIPKGQEEVQSQSEPRKIETPKSEPLKTDSSAHNYSSIYRDIETPTVANPPKLQLLVRLNSDTEKDTPKSLSTNRIENFFASIKKTNSKDSTLDQYLAESVNSPSIDDSQETEYAYSEGSLRSLGSFENLTDIDKKTGVFHGDEYDSDSSGTIHSSSSSFQSSFSSDSERAFSP